MTAYHIVTATKWDKTDPVLQAADEYYQRLTRYRATHLHIIKPKDPEREAMQFKKLQQPNSIQASIVLDEKGKQLDSIALSERLNSFEQQGLQKLWFVVGGAYGVSEEFRKTADFCWSLGKITLPHKIALLVLFEQLYRAHSILRKEPYHHGS